MFNLNENVKQWRRSLEVQSEIFATDIDELEDHLREEFTALKSLGLLDDEAFLISTRRLGTAGKLCSEFSIADPKLRRNSRLSWMITGALALVFLHLTTQTLTNFSTGFFIHLQGINGFTRSHDWLSWATGVFQITILGLGGMYIWRLLTVDRISHRLRSFNRKTVILISLIFPILVLAARIASKTFMVRVLAREEFMDIALTSAYINLAAIFVLPVLLLFGLRRLSKA